jgi:hypothetical protein
VLRKAAAGFETQILAVAEIIAADPEGYSTLQLMWARAVVRHQAESTATHDFGPERQPAM